jgi:hypothetical protein
VSDAGRDGGMGGAEEERGGLAYGAPLFPSLSVPSKGKVVGRGIIRPEGGLLEGIVMAAPARNMKGEKRTSTVKALQPNVSNPSAEGKPNRYNFHKPTLLSLCGVMP